MTSQKTYFSEKQKILSRNTPDVLVKKVSSRLPASVDHETNKQVKMSASQKKFLNPLIKKGFLHSSFPHDLHCER